MRWFNGRMRPEADPAAGGGTDNGAGAGEASEWTPPSREEYERLTKEREHWQGEAKSAFAARDEERAAARALMERLGSAVAPDKSKDDLPDYGDIAPEDRKFLELAEERGYKKAQKWFEQNFGEPFKEVTAATRERAIKDAESDIARRLDDMRGSKEKPGRYFAAPKQAIIGAMAAYAPALDTGRITREDYDRAVEAAAKEAHEEAIERAGWARQRQEATEAERAEKKVAARRGGGFRSGVATPREAQTYTKDRAGYQARMRDFIASRNGG